MRANLPVGITSSASQAKGGCFARLAVATSRLFGAPADLSARRRRRVGGDRPAFRLQQHIAAGYQYRYDDRHLPGGLSDSGDANRDTLAPHLKLHELILATKDARNHIAGIEDASNDEIECAKGEVLKRGG